ncbi:hypothetical protein [Streptomyces sp. NPDC046685]|uniref:hypothetical protein n=1 Tax=Streptomyces sp. NPDC046685 TaxID=3157202 RepID=UPI0033D24A73
MTDDQDRMEREAFDLHRLTLEVEASEAHPDGACTQGHTRCAGCGLLAPIAVKYGGPMAYCRLCYSGWAVHHDPIQCWRRSSFFDGWASEELAAARVLDLVSLLQAARDRLGEIVDTL